MSRPRATTRPAFQSPPASADVTFKADFLELKTFACHDRSSSIQDLVQETRRSGTAEAFTDPESAEYRRDAGGELSQIAAEDAFAEIEDRWRACGSDVVTYPFIVSGSSIRLSDSPEGSIYPFLLLLTQFGIKAGPSGLPAERLFERVCCEAAKHYFGGPGTGVEAARFGFPRDDLPKRFEAALDQLCQMVGEIVPKQGAVNAAQQKDARLDIVVWKHFPDRRAGKLLGFVQCAAGQNSWRQKSTELRPHTFCNQWLREHPAVEPLRLFFVPWRVARHEHRPVCCDGGILFDRCRIAHFARLLPDTVTNDCRRWTAHVLRTRLNTRIAPVRG